MHNNRKPSRRIRPFSTGHFKALIALTIVAGPVFASPNPGYNRPGIGFAPAVLKHGDITWEQGAPDFSHSGDATLYTADALVRLGIGGNFEAQLGTSYNRLSYSGHSVSGRGDGDHLAAFNAGRALSDSLGVYGEVAWQHVAGSGDGTMAGGGITRQAAPRVQLDASFRHRLGGELDTWQGGIGVSIFFDRP